CFGGFRRGLASHHSGHPKNREPGAEVIGEHLLVKERLAVISDPLLIVAVVGFRGRFAVLAFQHFPMLAPNGAPSNAGGLTQRRGVDPAADKPFAQLLTSGLVALGNTRY